MLNANRYNERKDLLSTIKGFALAKSEFNRETKLVMHTPNIHPIHQKILEDAIDDLNIGDDVMINPLGNTYISDDQLNDLYNLCDIGVNTSLGEGWGLISFEHALCGKAQIVPDHTSPRSHCSGIAEVIRTSEEVQLPTNPFKMMKVDPNRLARSMIKLVNLPDLRNAVARSCRQLPLLLSFNGKM